MKNIIKTIGLLSLIITSFFYTDKIIQVMQEEDNITKEINNIKLKKELEPINATITNNEIIPGINGRIINENKSYKKMKKIGVFDENEIIYDIIKPQISITNNKDKIITKGNKNKKNISLIFIINENKSIKKINEIAKQKNIIINYFLEDQYLINNPTIIKNYIKNSEFYSYGNNGKYIQEKLLFSNNLINRLANNIANICIIKDENKSTLEICSKNNLYTIKPIQIEKEDCYNKIKNHIEYGNIILLENTEKTINELNIIIDYIKGKGINIKGLSEIISEEY